MICARSEVGLSRLPVTEEIAGSNPVERATDIFHPDRVFFYGKYTIFIAFLYNLCYYIANWTGRSKEFYNKISDNVRGRIPSIMVRNREQFNPSDSETQLPTLLKEKALKGIATAAALLASVAPLSACGESYSEPTPNVTTPTLQKSPTPSPEASTTKAEKNIPQEVIDRYKDVTGLGDLKNKINAEMSGEDMDYNEWRNTLIEFVNSTTSDENAKVVTDENGLIKTTEDDLAKDMDPATLNSIYLILYTGAIYKDSQLHGYPLSAEESGILKKHVLDTTNGQAKSLLSGFLEPGRDNYSPLFDITPSDLKLTVKFTSSGKKDGLYATYQYDPFNKANKCSVEGNIAECKPESDTRRGAYAPEIQKVVTFECNDHTSADVVVRAFVDVALPEDVSNLNKPGSKPETRDLHDNRFGNNEEVFATVAVGGYSILTKDSYDKEFLIQNGKLIAPSEIPGIDKPEN